MGVDFPKHRLLIAPANNCPIAQLRVVVSQKGKNPKDVTATTSPTLHVAPVL